ncbi:GNAT family N-acetyltransferase [Nocardia sp. NPDC058658]|uniref:GNAT family N-acetyltransferase n=1 Tax=Nocardia sp. NPDC058658 TaxID=3346580 RepID=UPI00366464B6
MRPGTRSYADVRLGPVNFRGLTVVLRPPRFDDFADWRRIRLRDRDRIEPHWFRSPLNWEHRHTAAHWVHECLTARTEAAAGKRVATVLEIDGRFAGQIELLGIEAGAAEASAWVDGQVARRGAAGLAVALLIDFGFGSVGLDRITAPISVANPAARRVIHQRWTREAVMAGYFDTGSGRVDHELWAVTRDRVPAGGLAADWSAHVGPVDATGPGRVVTSRPTISRYTIARTWSRYQLGRLWHAADPLRAQVRGTVRGEHSTVSLRPLRRDDFSARRAARIAAHPVLAATMRREQWARLHTRREWYRTRMSTRPGLLGKQGVVLVIDVAGRYAGECRLFDRDMFDRNVRAALWVSPDAGPDVAVRALRLLVMYATEQLGIWRLAMAVPTADRAGAEVAHEAGLRHEGTMHYVRGPGGALADHELWAFSTSVSAPTSTGEAHP